MIIFTEWLMNLNEIKFSALETDAGSSMSDDKLLAMYITYFQAYSAEGLKPWTFDQWKYSRGEVWKYIGVLPKPEDVQKCRDAITKVTSGKSYASDSDMQKAAEQVMAADPNIMGYAGGISYRFAGRDGLKITSSFGKNPTGKMRAAAEVIKMANDAKPPMQIFTAADDRLKDLITKAEEKMPSLQKMGAVPVASLGLTTPPKSIIPVLYNTIKNMPGAHGHGTWTGFDPETGALKMNLSGTGEVKKFVFGNKALWQNAIKGMLERSGHLDQVMKAKKVVDGGGVLGWGAKKALLIAVNTALSKYAEGAKLDDEGLMWVLSNLDD